MARPEDSFGEPLATRVRDARILVIGAGGIGCELLKNLVLTGFRDIEVVDLDTIDVSNLNRQFLFRPAHVGKSKAEVAASVVSSLMPGVSVKAHYGNVKEARFGVPFVRGFTVCVNALDNMEARRHMNRLCLAAGVPLVEAGTMGYAGQVFVIRKGETQCLECNPTPPQKQYPICTIRSLPEKPVHCVVWAKELFKLLLGDAKTSTLYDGPSTDEADANGKKKQRDSYMDVVEAVPSIDAADARAAATTYARAVFQSIFHDDIATRMIIAPEAYRNARVPPQPLDLKSVEAGTLFSGSGGASGEARQPEAGGASSVAAITLQRVLSVAESAAGFIESLVSFFLASPIAVGSIEFNKDATDHLTLVTAATNLRAATFGIALQSAWDVKSIAGNIIPAIATTNAIAAGLQVLEVLKVLQGPEAAPRARITFISRAPTGSRKRSLLTALNLQDPRPGCYVCGTQTLQLRIDTTVSTLRVLINDVLRGALGFSEPNVDNGAEFNFIESREDGEDDDEYEQKVGFLRFPLNKLVGGGIVDGSVLCVTDFAQELTIAINVFHVPQADLGDATFKIVGAIDAEAASALARSRATAAEASADAAAPASSAQAQKRDRDTGSDTIEIDDNDDEPAQPVSKRAKTSDKSESEVIAID
jgi:ubiquitin-like 1-activating enzyme E1 B